MKHLVFTVILYTMTFCFAGGLAVANTIFSDGTYDPANWTTVLEYGNGTVSATQVNMGGNPDRYLRVDHINFTWELVAYHFQNDAVYDPSLAPIERVEWSQDERAIQNLFGIGVPFTLAVEQNGKRYKISSYSQFRNDSSSWVTFTSPIGGYTAADFFQYDIPGNVLLEDHPDFSSTGSPLVFGFCTLDNNLDYLTSRAAGFDNWSVTLTTVPIPAAIWLLGSGLIGLVGIRKKLRKS